MMFQLQEISTVPFVAYMALQILPGRGFPGAHPLTLLILAPLKAIPDSNKLSKLGNNTITSCNYLISIITALMTKEVKDW